MIDLAAARARDTPDGLAIDDRGSGRRMSWADLARAAEVAAERLGALGVGRGDRVAIAAPAGTAFAIVLHATARLGASLVPLAPRGRADELARPLATCRPRVALADGPGVAAELAAAARGAAGAEGQAVRDVGDVVEGSRSAGGGRGGGPVPGRRGLAAADELCVVHTSGTSGHPRGVRLTLANQLASARGCAQSLELGPADHWLLALAPHHVGGLAVLVRSAVLGHPVTVLPRFDPAAVLAALEAGGPTVLPLVPTMLAELVDAGGTDRLRRLRAVLLGGAPAAPSDVAAWAGLGIPVCPSYGLTETGSQVATVPPGRAATLGASAGLPHRFARLRILAEDGAAHPCGPGVVGRIEVRGAVVSPGYVGPDTGEGPGHGRFLTRDRGWLDAAGVLHVQGRLDDVIQSGGELVQPELVEAVLRRHRLVADAAVVGVPDPRWGQLVVAIVAARPGTRAEAERALPIACRAALSGAAVPRRWCFVERIPRTEGGKLRRRELLPLALARGGGAPAPDTLRREDR